MQKFDELWQVIETRVCENNDITQQELTNDESARGNAARQRIAHIFTLEVLLSRHRDKYGSPYMSLAGEEALWHLIFKRTGWKPFEIKQLSFSDAMFVIAELFREENLPADVRGILRANGLRDQAYSLYEFSEKDWAPRENENILKGK
ncbi:ECs1072 family phage-associated protein [Phytobacter massiliensis]|uniref:ECs1072 family phage-associated protein n=1 Tax=Phytobacter massiliensis TaxID=1485952 RepID=UPI000300F4F6|nr:hypothetical protein [Phytobacter massiliensis]